jgi:hypothetical protein
MSVSLAGAAITTSLLAAPFDEDEIWKLASVELIDALFAFGYSTIRLITYVS